MLMSLVWTRLKGEQKDRTKTLAKFPDHILNAWLWPRTHGNVFLRFCIVSSNELVVFDSLENSKQYKNAGKRFRVHGAYAIVHAISIPSPCRFVLIEYNLGMIITSIVFECTVQWQLSVSDWDYFFNNIFFSRLKRCSRVRSDLHSSVVNQHGNWWRDRSDIRQYYPWNRRGKRHIKMA